MSCNPSRPPAAAAAMPSVFWAGVNLNKASPLFGPAANTLSRLGGPRDKSPSRHQLWVVETYACEDVVDTYDCGDLHIQFVSIPGICVSRSIKYGHAVCDDPYIGFFTSGLAIVQF